MNFPPPLRVSRLRASCKFYALPKMLNPCHSLLAIQPLSHDKIELNKRLGRFDP